MKKILSLFIVSLLFFNLSVNLFSMTFQNSADISEFDDFALEQVQKTFSSSLYGGGDAQNESQNLPDDFFLSREKDLVLQNSFFAKTDGLKSCLCAGIFKSGINNKQFKYGGCVFLCGLTKFQINLNSYMSMVIPDDGHTSKYTHEY